MVVHSLSRKRLYLIPHVCFPFRPFPADQPVDGQSGGSLPQSCDHGLLRRTQERYRWYQPSRPHVSHTVEHPGGVLPK